MTLKRSMKRTLSSVPAAESLSAGIKSRETLNAERRVVSGQEISVLSFEFSDLKSQISNPRAEN
jgi:hypothetical protein